MKAQLHEHLQETKLNVSKHTTNFFSQTLLKGSKKAAIMMALLLTVCVSYSFAKPTDSLNGDIRTSFRKDFQNARIISTEGHKGFTKLTFKMDDMIMFAFYSENGQLLAVTRNIVSSQLPISLLMSLKNDYSGYWITELFELNSNDQSCYYVSLENANAKLTLRSNGDSWEVYSTTKK